MWAKLSYQRRVLGNYSRLSFLNMKDFPNFFFFFFILEIGGFSAAKKSMCIRSWKNFNEWLKLFQIYFFFNLKLKSLRHFSCQTCSLSPVFKVKLHNCCWKTPLNCGFRIPEILFVHNSERWSYGMAELEISEILPNKTAFVDIIVHSGSSSLSNKTRQNLLSDRCSFTKSLWDEK